MPSKTNNSTHIKEITITCIPSRSMAKTLLQPPPSTRLIRLKKRECHAQPMETTQVWSTWMTIQISNQVTGKNLRSSKMLVVDKKRSTWIELLWPKKNSRSWKKPRDRWESCGRVKQTCRSSGKSLSLLFKVGTKKMRALQERVVIWLTLHLRLSAMTRFFCSLVNEPRERNKRR